MKLIIAWIRASRLPSQSYIALPLIVGQLLAYRIAGAWSWEIFALVQLFGLFDQLYIVYANDYADQDTDARNETFTMFSGGSRVLVDGAIRPETLKKAAFLMAAMSAAVGVVLLVGFGHALPLPLILAGLGLLWAYSYPPLRVSYRGGGELLQMLGVGAVLPLIGYSAQAGGLEGFPWLLLAAILPLNLATAMSTALPDEPSDRASDKRTSAVLLGTTAARAGIIALNLLGLGAFALLGAAAVEPHLNWSALQLTMTSLGALLPAIVLARWAKPGTRAILAFVFFAVLSNLAFLAGLSIDLAG